jgi:hypothetical protein
MEFGKTEGSSGQEARPVDGKEEAWTSDLTGRQLEVQCRLDHGQTEANRTKPGPIYVGVLVYAVQLHSK